MLREIPKCGLAAARNAACLLAKAHYLAIQDADDLSLPNRLETQIDFMKEHPEVGIVGSAIQRIDEHGNNLPTVNNYPTEDQQIRQTLGKWNTFWQPTVLMRTEAFVGVGGYREILPPSEDYDLWLRISEHYKCANLPQILVKYRIHSQQVSMRKRKTQILCALAGQASASLRQQGKPDPLIHATEVTPALLASMGISEFQQRNALAGGYLSMMNEMYRGGAHDAVSEAAAEMFKLCESQRVDQQLLSDAHILSAKAQWKQRKIFRSILSAGQAVLARPRITRHPFRLFRRLLLES